jgi:hypothetical protein
MAALGQDGAQGVGVGVGDVDDHPQPVQLPHDVAAEGGQAAMTRRLVHDVAQLVDAVVDQLDPTDAPIVEMSHARQFAFERIRALEGENRARRARLLALDHVPG